MMNAKESNIFSRISSFSVILIVLVLVVIGAGIMPLLNVQYTPSGEQQGVSVNYSWNNASGNRGGGHLEDRRAAHVDTGCGARQFGHISGGRPCGCFV